MSLLEQLVVQAQADFAAATDAAALENAKARYLGKTGQITEQMKSLGKLAPEERKVQGAIINAAKEQVETALTARRDGMAESLADRAPNGPGKPPPFGSKQPGALGHVSS